MWMELFEILVTNSVESDSEIRNTSLNIFSGIINNYGREFTMEIWEKVMKDIYLKSFDNILEIYFNLIREESKGKNLPDTPSFVLQMKKSFENKIKKRFD